MAQVPDIGIQDDPIYYDDVKVDTTKTKGVWNANSTYKSQSYTSHPKSVEGGVTRRPNWGSPEPGMEDVPDDAWEITAQRDTHTHTGTGCRGLRSDTGVVACPRGDPVSLLDVGDSVAVGKDGVDPDRRAGLPLTRVGTE